MADSFTQELNGLQVGQSLAKAVTAPVADIGDKFERLKQNHHAAVSRHAAKHGGTFTTNAVDGLVEGMTRAIRCMVTTRLA